MKFATLARIIALTSTHCSIDLGPVGPGNTGKTSFLDPQFGTDGIAFYSQQQLNGGYSIVLQSDQKLLVAGSTASTTPRRFAVGRLNSNGNIDSAFGTAGIANISPNSTVDEEARAVGVLSDGSIVAAGSRYSSTGWRAWGYAKWQANGTAFTTFGSGGAIIDGIDGANMYGVSLATDTAGNLAAAGNFNCGGPVYAASQLRDASGNLVTAFDGDGRKCSTSAGAGSFLSALQLNPADTHVVIAGKDSSDRVLVGKLAKSDGSNVTAFSFGYTEFQVNGASVNEAKALHVNSDDSVIVAGGADGNAFVTKVLGDGNIDTTFAANGFFILNLGGMEIFEGLKIDAQNKIVLVGNAGNDTCLIVRLQNNGALDTTFGSLGIMQVKVPGTLQLKCKSLVVQADGKIVVSGEADGRVAVMRLTN